MSTEPSKPAGSPPDSTVWSNDVAGGGVNANTVPGNELPSSTTTATTGDGASGPTASKKKKKKKKQQQQQQRQAELKQKDKVDEEAGEDEEGEDEMPTKTPEDLTMEQPELSSKSETVPEPTSDLQAEAVEHPDPPHPAALDSSSPISKPEPELQVPLAEPLSAVPMPEETKESSAPDQEDLFSAPVEGETDDLFGGPVQAETDDLFGKVDAEEVETSDLFDSAAPTEGMLVDEVRLEEPVVDIEEIAVPIGSATSEIEEARHNKGLQADAEFETVDEPTNVQPDNSNHGAEETDRFRGQADTADDLFGTQPVADDAFDSFIGSTAVPPAPEREPALDTPVQAKEDSLFDSIFPSGEDDLFGAPPVSEPFALELSSIETVKPFEGQSGDDDLFGADETGAEDLFGHSGQQGASFGEAQTPAVSVQREAEKVDQASAKPTDFGAIVLDSPTEDPFGGPADEVEDDFFSSVAKPVQPEENPQQANTIDTHVQGRSRASTKTSDLFQGDDAGDLFADIGQPGQVPESAADMKSDREQGEDLFGTSADDDLFGNGQVANVANTIDEPFPNPATDAPVVSATSENVFDTTELDLMGVPEGWMDGEVWCWYTEDERNEVAKQMIADGTAEAPERKPLESATPQLPALASHAAPTIGPYAPVPAQTYSPIQVDTSSVTAAIPYVPSSSISRYGSPAVQSYASPAYAPSPYTPSPYAPAAPNNFQNTGPYASSSAMPKHVVSPPAPLQRSATTTAYDPPVPASRNLSRPPSAAPVLSQYAPFSYALGPASTPVSPPSSTGPPRSSGPSRGPASVKSSLVGQSTPTAYDPPVPSMSRQPSYAKLKPAVEVAPPLPPLPQALPQPTNSLASVAPPPGHPRGPSRSASFMQPPPTGTYRPPSRARVETSEQQASLRPAAPPVPPLPRDVSVAADPSYGLPAPPAPAVVSLAQTTPSQDSGRTSVGYQAPPSAAQAVSMLPLPVKGGLTPANAGPSYDPASSEPSSATAPGVHQMTPQRSEAVDLPPSGETWPHNASPAKPRPLLREDTFDPPALSSQDDFSYIDPEDGPLEDADPMASEWEPPRVTDDPYKPAPPSYVPAPSQPAPKDYQPYVAQAVSAPFDPYQPKSQDVQEPSIYDTPVPNTFTFPNDNYGSPALSNGSPAVSGSAYEPTSESVAKPLSEDILERASPKARRVPCVSFGPQGQCVVVFQSEPSGNGSENGQWLLPAYGDRSQEQKVQLHQLKDVIPQEGVSATTADWPGPLFIDAAASKVTAASKKKRDAVNAYIDARVQEIRSGLVYLTASKNDQASRDRAEARMLMLEIVKLMIANDGKALQNDVSSRNDLVNLLSSHVPSVEGDPALRQRAKTTEPVATAADLQYLSRMLVKGQQLEAQQYAIQQQLWSHALLISSVMGPQAWQSCVDAFVGQTASTHDLGQPLITAYKMFGGTQQLAPSSGQAGAWRDSIATIVANAKAADVETLVKLADQLKQIGLVEASHVCYLLSPKLTEWAAGVDVSRVALFGCSDVTSTGRDLEISELVEYALSFRTVAKGAEPYHGVPRLLAYKLQKALELFTRGQASEARAYCDAVLSQSKSYKSPNPAITAVLRHAETLSGRIAGIAVTAAATRKGGKPNLENLGSWFEGRLTKFIAGDEEADEKPAQPSAGKEASGKAAIGPFSHYSAISSPNATPNLTRSSTYDLAGQQGAAPGPHAYRSGSAASYRPRQPSQLSMQRPTSAMSYHPQEQSAFPEMTRITSRINEQDGFDARRDSGQEIPQDTQATATAVTPSDPAAEPQIQMPSWGQSYDEPEGTEDRHEADEADADAGGSFINPMQTFMSPMATTASSYDPSVAAAVSSQPAYGNDDDDDLGLGNTSHKKQAVNADSKTDASKSTAASSSYEPVPAKEEPSKPEPAKKTNPSAESGKGSQGSWLGKWWGKKEETAGPGPVKAKLGEESAFYYDKELKRWVNKTAGASETPKAAPPPPPAARSTPVSASPASTPHPIASTSTPQPSSVRDPSIPPGSGTAPPVRPPSASAPPGPRTMPPAGGPRPPMNAADPPLADPLAAPPMRKPAAKGKKDLRAKYVNVL